MAALGAIDIALHDLKGKILRTPIYDLLGGKQRDSIELYASLMRCGRSVEEEVERVQAVMADGFRAVKIHTGTPWGEGDICRIERWKRWQRYERHVEMRIASLSS